VHVNKEQLVGLLAGIFSGGGAIALTLPLAFRTFWWCPEGGCSLAGVQAKLSLLSNLIGVVLLLAAFSLLLLFVFVLLARPFVNRDVMERVLLGLHIPGLGWYDKLQLKWVALLYRGAAA
jgi:hypothetical protein